MRSSRKQFHYDAAGNAIAVTYNGTEYYYVRNAQGDIVKLIDSTGATVVEYTYDSWGKLLSTTGSLAITFGADQPFRYRGYTYDAETQLYYLQTRYYDPTTCRFISSDFALSTGQGVLGHNAYAYCLNNPAGNCDPTGFLSWKKVINTTVFNAALLVTIVAIAAIVIISSGGTAAPPLLAAAGAIAGTTVTAGTATTVAMGLAATGIATMGVAATANVYEMSGKGGKDYVQAKNNKQANQWAKEVGYDAAEQLKADYVGKQRSKFNMYTNRSTGEIILIGLTTAKEIATQLFLK